MIGEKARPNVPPSPFCLLFLEAPRGLDASPRDGRRASFDGAARAVSMTPAYESLWRRSAECRLAIGEAWQLAFLWRAVTPERSLARRDHARPVIVPGG